MKNELVDHKCEATNPDEIFHQDYLDQVRSRDTDDCVSHVVSSRPNHSEWFYVNEGTGDYKFAFPEMLKVSSYFILHFR